MAQAGDDISDIETALLARAEEAWAIMPHDVKFAMKKQLAKINAFSGIKEVARFYKDGQWSIRPFRDQSQWGDLGLKGATLIYKRLWEVS